MEVKCQMEGAVPCKESESEALPLCEEAYVGEGAVEDQGKSSMKAFEKKTDKSQEDVDVEHKGRTIEKTIVEVKCNEKVENTRCVEETGMSREAGAETNSEAEVTPNIEAEVALNTEAEVDLNTEAEVATKKGVGVETITEGEAGEID